MKICRFRNMVGGIAIGLVQDEMITDLSAAGIETLAAILNAEDLPELIKRSASSAPPAVPVSEVQLLAPVDQQEVWAAGVTYLRSKAARMEESESSASAYDRVYDAERPEIFFKSLPQKVVGTGDAVGIRGDATWSVPEPELALVINTRGQIVGHTIANDMSSRDIEGENLLYLPQAKTYHRSCALGPWIVLGTPEDQAREWTIEIKIERDTVSVFRGQASVGQIKRQFSELAAFLFRSQTFPHGAVLLTGTGIVPPDSFTLRQRDTIRIAISGIGVLANHVVVV
jgi:2-dehydro-3-deoxy-D-arabinonate dehydratase